MTQDKLLEIAVSVAADIFKMLGKKSEREIAEHLCFELEGLLRVHNDSVREVLFKLLHTEAEKRCHRHKDDPFEGVEYQGLFDAASMVGHASLPFDQPDLGKQQK
jgi:hypothetical protein